MNVRKAVLHIFYRWWSSHYPKVIATIELLGTFVFNPSMEIHSQDALHNTGEVNGNI